MLAAEQKTERLITVTEEITPEIAAEYIKHNTRNRSLNEGKMRQFMKAMLRGEWTHNGESIKFGTDGTLLDGQTRLWAVIKSGVTIVSEVSRGVALDAQLTMDSGGRRSLASQMKIMGIPDSNKSAAAVNLYHKYITRHMKQSGGEYYPTTPEGIQIFEDNRGIADAVIWTSRLNKQLGMNTSVAQTFAYIFQSIDAEDGADFMERLWRGNDLEEGNPILALRNWLMKNSSVPSKDRHDRIYEAAVTVKAWNAYRKGQNLHLLVWRRGGKANEDFPEAI